MDGARREPETALSRGRRAGARGRGRQRQPVPLETLVRAGNAFAEAHSAEGAQTLAWQRMAAKDWVAAAAWFQAARAWRGSSEEDPKTLEGLIQALRELRRDDEAEELAYARAAHEDTFRELYLEIVADRLTRTPPAPPNEAGLRRSPNSSSRPRPPAAPKRSAGSPTTRGNGRPPSHGSIGR